MKDDENTTLTQAMLEDMAAQSIANHGQSDLLIMDPAHLAAFTAAFTYPEWQRTETAKKIEQAWQSNMNVDHTEHTIMRNALKAFYNLGLERSLLK